MGSPEGVFVAVGRTDVLVETRMAVFVAVGGAGVEVGVILGALVGRGVLVGVNVAIEPVDRVA